MVVEAVLGGFAAPSTAAGVYPVVGFGSRKMCWLPQYSQTNISVSDEKVVRPPQEGHSRVMILSILFILKGQTLRDIV